MKRVLLTGAGGPAGINFVESVRKAPENIYIVGTDINKWHLELPNVDKRYIISRCTEKNYIDKLNELIHREDIEFIHSQPDTELKVLSDNREKIDAITYLPDKKTIDICQNKFKTNDILRKNDVPSPKTFLINNLDDLKNAMNELIDKKTDKVWLRAIKGAGSRGSLPIKEVYHGQAWIDYWNKMKGINYGDFIANEYLPGHEFAFQSIWKDGELITSMARERLEYLFGDMTISGQSSSPSVAKSVHRTDVNEIATAAVLSVDKNATGIFCVDLKENTEGIPCVTEINAGRFFTTTYFFSKIGSNMPYFYIKLAYGEEIQKLTQYNTAPENYYWVRLMDHEPILVRDGDWKSYKI